MDLERQKGLAARFRELHRASPILVLPNAWDGWSARSFEAAGFPAVATTSAGVAAALGHADGERVPFDQLLWMVRRIVETVAVPVSVDLEAGYGPTLAAVQERCEAVLKAGAVGVNIEDGTGDAAKPLADLQSQIPKIQGARAAGLDMSVPLLINARTDVFLRSVGPAETRFERAIERLTAYKEAGADCLFVPGVSEPSLIARFVRALGAPLNVLAVAGTPPIAELAALGVARVTLGSGPMRAAAALVRRIAQEVRQQGTYRSFTESALSHAELKQMFSGPGHRPSGA